MELFTYNQGVFHPSKVFTPSILQEAAPILTVDVSDANVCHNDEVKLSSLAHELLLHINQAYGTMFNDYAPPMAIRTESGYIKTISVQLHRNMYKI